MSTDSASGPGRQQEERREAWGQETVARGAQAVLGRRAGQLGPPLPAAGGRTGRLGQSPGRGSGQQGVAEEVSGRRLPTMRVTQ